jgi:hypothetical protein
LNLFISRFFNASLHPGFEFIEARTLSKRFSQSFVAP